MNKGKICQQMEFRLRLINPTSTRCRGMPTPKAGRNLGRIAARCMGPEEAAMGHLQRQQIHAGNSEAIACLRDAAVGVRCLGATRIPLPLHQDPEAHERRRAPLLSSVTRDEQNHEQMRSRDHQIFEHRTRLPTSPRLISADACRRTRNGFLLQWRTLLDGLHKAAVPKYSLAVSVQLVP